MAPRRFKTRHLSMMALGTAIGAGFFLGTGQAIYEAGPAVLISYGLAAFIAVSVMYALAEMAAALPSTGSFSTYAQAGIGRWAGFTVGWLYWFMLMMVLGMEITGAAEIFVKWFPAVPQWSVALAIVVVFGGVNLLAAGDFGEVEAWLAGIKVFAIIAFLVIAVGLLTGIIPGREAPIADTVLGHGGWIPNGLTGIAVGILAVITSFGGIEVVTIAAAEAEDARTAISRAIRSVIWRILIFYVGTVALLVCLLPWNSEQMRGTPLATVLDMAGVPNVGLIMEVIVFIALVSAFSAIIYSSSRLAYSLSARNMGMRWLLGKDAIIPEVVRRSSAESGLGAVVAGEAAAGDMSHGRTPRRAVSVSIALSLVSVALNWWLPDVLLGILINAIGMILLVVWVFIIVAQMRLRPQLEQAGALSIRMPGWPVLPWVVLVCLAALGVLMATTEAGRGQLLAMGGLTVVVIALFFIRQWWLKQFAH
nr:amino acid permease [Schaalia suimastitidis]